MRRGFPICVLCLPSAEGCADMPAAQRRFAEVLRAKVIRTKPLHKSKRWSHYRLAQDLFIEFQYDSLTSTVAVLTVQLPHYPWIMSERALDRTLVRTSGERSKGGESRLGTPLTAMCQQL